MKINRLNQSAVKDHLITVFGCILELVLKDNYKGLVDYES